MSHHKGSAKIIRISPAWSLCTYACGNAATMQVKSCSFTQLLACPLYRLTVTSLLLLLFILDLFLLHALVAPSLIRMLSYDHVLVTHTVMSKTSPMQIRISPFRIRRMLRPPTVAQRLANRKSGHQYKRANPQRSQENKELAASPCFQACFGNCAHYYTLIYAYANEGRQGCQ